MSMNEFSSHQPQVRSEDAPTYGGQPSLTLIRQDDEAVKAAEDSVIAQALSILAKRFEKRTYFDSPQDTKDYFRLKYSERKSEVFVCAFLDNRHRLLACEEMFQGTIDGASVHPREIVRRALDLNCAAMLIAHNHPSGDPNPSIADIKITARIKEALNLISVRVLDHLVVAGEGVVSLAEQGRL